jgi:hypothetical protein
VLDAAQDKRILQILRAAVEESRSLYEGNEADELAEVAPYLVALPGQSRLLPRLIEEGWGQSWGIYLSSRRPFKEVRRHLRRLLLVRVKETGRPLYFRFYDPKVLDLVLPIFTARQHQLLFGDIDAFVYEAANAAVRRAVRPGA